MILSDLNLDFLGDGVEEVAKSNPYLLVLAVIIIAFFLIMLFFNQSTVKQIRKSYDKSKDDLYRLHREQMEEMRNNYKDLLNEYKELQESLKKGKNKK